MTKRSSLENRIASKSHHRYSMLHGVSMYGHTCWPTNPHSNPDVTHKWLTELIPCTEFLTMKSLDTTSFKSAWGSKLDSHQWSVIHSMHQIQGSLNYQMLYSIIIFMKMWSMKNLGHIQITKLWITPTWCTKKVTQFFGIQLMFNPARKDNI